MTLNIKNPLNAALVFDSGHFLLGKFIGKPQNTVGEICFTTSSLGYQESITDPSYAGQILTFAFPHIGNTGANNEDIESVVMTNPLIKGIVIRNNITSHYNRRAQESLEDMLAERKIPCISEIDTRAIILYIRKYGHRNCMITTYNQDFSLDKTLAELKKLSGLASDDPITEPLPMPNMSTNNKGPNIVVIDMGTKLNIIRILQSLGCNTEIVPNTTPAAEILAKKPDGILISNGPGNPCNLPQNIIQNIRLLIESKTPIFGICMGHQVISLAMNAEIIKMPQGHRGSNHPVYDYNLKKVIITSQNHGFAVTENFDKEEIEITHRSLFDNTIAGIKLKKYPVMSVQFHPENAPGTHDAEYLFTNFIDLITNK